MNTFKSPHDQLCIMQKHKIENYIFFRLNMYIKSVPTVSYTQFRYDTALVVALFVNI